MFAAASGARLAHRHNKMVKKQMSTNQVEGYQVHSKSFQRHQRLKNANIHGLRYSGIPQRRLAYSSKLYSSNYNPGFEFSTSYIDMNGRISKLGQYDFEGKAAWQDRELLNELSRRKSICILSEVHNASKIKQKEAHRRWIRKNRIQDLSLDDFNSYDDLFYEVQNSAANLLLYVGLGTLCIGMIIAFVGTGEKGFKTKELRLIGPFLIGAGILIVILRIMLCVCPSKCFHLKKQKHTLKNSTNKLNSEGSQVSQSLSMSMEQANEETTVQQTKTTNNNNSQESNQSDSIAMLPTTSGISTNSQTSSHSHNAVKIPHQQETAEVHPSSVTTVSYFENEKPTSSKSWNKKSSKPSTPTNSDEKSLFDVEEIKSNFEMKEMTENDFESSSLESLSSSRKYFTECFPESLVSPDRSDISITSVVNLKPNMEVAEDKGDRKTKSSKFEAVRNPKNSITSELVLSPATLNEANDGNKN